MDKKDKYAVPQTLNERMRLRNLIEEEVSRSLLVAPVSMDDLSSVATYLIDTQHINEDFKGWLMVEINNRFWRNTVAAVPYERRMLLLPQCLRNTSCCEAEIDDLGLLCRRCGRCKIFSLEQQAENLNIMSLVAEGFTTVINLLENNVISTVIGVGCLESLEKVFPLMIKHGIPGLAVPLNHAGCKDTDVDNQYISEMMQEYNPDNKTIINYHDIRDMIRMWFTRENAGLANDPASEIALNCLCGSGKRWRPFLTVAVWSALTGQTKPPDTVRFAALAVECFHKASLVHDDLQDGDALRYGEQTVHAQYGVPIAVNTGDYLIGKGYERLSECNVPSLTRVASAAHLALCKGQGLELEWRRTGHKPTLEEILQVHGLKTVPAFEAALVFGSICADGDDVLNDILRKYAYNMGIAYQLLDDYADYEDVITSKVWQPSAVAAVINNETDVKQAKNQIYALAEQYRRNALETLKAIRNTELKRLLYHLISQIFKA
ncbi:MAG: polyprenyl synthetase family protein [Tannerella sp.]|jgi:geranylgeranyl pyrophosphate synthase|nr:polyprenyl synthetase family protein [Tannerella sp.]